MIDYEIGCVLFVNENEGIDGIGYTPKQQQVNVRSYKELDPNIIWITNLSQDLTLNSEHLKSLNFFGIKINSLIYQMGLSYMKRDVISAELYLVAKNIVDKLSQTYNIKLTEDTLVKNLINNFGLKNIKYKDDKKVVDILKQNNSNFEVTNIAKTKNEFQTYLFFPRYDYSRRLCKTSIPKGKWKDLDKNIFENKSSKWFLNLSKKYHFLALVKLTNIPNELNCLIPEKYRTGKVWMTDVEFLFFSKYTSIHVDEVKACTGRMHLELIEPKKLFKLDSYEKSSISNGIAAYNYQRSFIENNPDSIMSSWINIYDKVTMLNIAMFFLKNNIKVISYGAGGLLISFTKNSTEANNVVRICEKLNLFYPMLLLTI